MFLYSQDCNKQGFALHPRMRNLRLQRKRSSLRFILLHPHPPLAQLSSVLEGEGRMKAALSTMRSCNLVARPPFLEQPASCFILMSRGLLIRKGLVQAGFGLVCEMVKKGVAIDRFTCNILVKGFCDMDLLPKAKWVMEMLRHNGEAISTDIVGFNTIIHGYFKACEMSDGLEITETMSQAGVLPDIITYSILINGFCQMGDLILPRVWMNTWSLVN
nr:pentatricopeptide repeat-containing protein At5g14770, mitochondrial [Ipomoea batatas]